MLRTLLVCVTLLALIAPAPASGAMRPPDGAQPDQPVSIPATTAGRQLRWVLRTLNQEEEQTDEAVAGHFTETFLESVSVADLRRELADIRSEVYEGKKVRAVRADEGDRDDTLTAVLAAKGLQRYLSVFIIVDEKSGKIAGLKFEAAGGGGGGETPEPTRGGTWQDMDRAVDEMQGDVSFGCYEVVPRDPANPTGELVLLDIAAKNENRTQAIGSTFKLYVLGALAEDAAAGRLKWTDELAVEDAKKSLPSGRMQLLADGTRRSVEEFAANMISISDNTATDHLIHLAGRERVEAFTNALNDNVARNTPFLTTREVFAIKLAASPAQAEQYLEADDAAQRAMLAPGGVIAGLTPELEQASEWGEPRMIESAEWFASARQIAQAWARLRQLERHPANEPVQRILRKNPGMALDNSIWTSVAFKGGSEPGVLSMSWLLQRDDGKWYVFSVGQNDHEKDVDQEAFNRLCYKGLAILADDGRPAPPETPAPAPPKPDPFMDTGDEPADPVDDGT